MERRGEGIGRRVCLRAARAEAWERAGTQRGHRTSDGSSSHDSRATGYRATAQQRGRLPLTDQKRAGNAQGTCGRRNPVNSAKFLPAALAIFSAVIV